MIQKQRLYYTFVAVYSASTHLTSISYCIATAFFCRCRCMLGVVALYMYAYAYLIVHCSYVLGF